MQLLELQRMQQKRIHLYSFRFRNMGGKYVYDQSEKLNQVTHTHRKKKKKNKEKRKKKKEIRAHNFYSIFQSNN